MTISVYAEYLAYRFGGTESYAASLLELLQKRYKDSQINVITESFSCEKTLSAEELVKQLNNAFGTSISSENISILYVPFGKHMPKTFSKGITQLRSEIRSIFTTKKRFCKIQEFARGTDLFVNTSFLTLEGTARKNIAIIHFPLTSLKQSGIAKRTLRRALYFFRIDDIERRFKSSYDRYLPNSDFTARWLARYWGLPENKISVVYPPCKMTGSQNATRHKNQILVCGKIARVKKVGALVSAYKMSETLRKNATLVIAGSVIGVDDRYVKELMSIEPSVKFVFDPTRKELDELYGTSGIFWHAKGFGTDKPLEFEHFGMTTVEAMSGGCIPIVIDKGGQREIVTDNCGFRWTTLEELVRQTESVIMGNNAEKLRLNAVRRAHNFSKEMFSGRLSSILDEVLGA